MNYYKVGLEVTDYVRMIISDLASVGRDPSPNNSKVIGSDVVLIMLFYKICLYLEKFGHSRRKCLTVCADVPQLQNGELIHSFTYKCALRSEKPSQSCANTTPAFRGNPKGRSEGLNNEDIFNVCLKVTQLGLDLTDK